VEKVIKTHDIPAKADPYSKAVAAVGVVDVILTTGCR
jgi:hypothetical protein